MEYEVVKPVVGQRYLVILAREEERKPFVGHTGICIEEYPRHPYPYLNAILKFDNEELEERNEWNGQYIWHTGTDIVLLEDQSYVR